ncbi:MAG: Carbonic anhydrase 2 [Chlamydiia bacterium]|nr:Carbonic anhydrase 2 [Chlamydiia bacterium]
MEQLEKLFQNNSEWVKKKTAHDPEYFTRLSGEQHPEYLWFGCADSRVPANAVVGLEPGELFVHRNIANVCQPTDMSALSVLEFAVGVLKVKHVIVCGHYGCGGVKAAMGNQQIGLIDNWIRSIRDVYLAHKQELDAIADENERFDRLVELNVLQQVRNISHTSILQKAWEQDQSVWIHGWVYDLKTGMIKDLNCCISGPFEIDSVYRVTS